MVNLVAFKPEQPYNSELLTPMAYTKPQMDLSTYLGIFGNRKLIKINYTGNSQTLLYTLPAGKVFLITAIQLCMNKLSTANDISYLYLNNDPGTAFFMCAGSLSGATTASAVSLYPPMRMQAGETLHFGVESSTSKCVGGIIGYEEDISIVNQFK